MRNMLTLCLLFFVCAIANAQFKTIAEGAVFEEPEEGFAKILQMKNGNTIFIHVTPKKEIYTQVYDAAHKKKAERSFLAGYEKDNVHVEGAFEINGDAVLIIRTADHHVPRLHRIIINGNTGVLKNEKQLAELSKVTMKQGYAAVFGGVPGPNFYVRKDPNSNNYALAILNSFESDRNKRIEVVFYGGDHKELSRAFYHSPDNKFKYMTYADMVVLGDEKVSILAYGYNTAASGGKESALLLANLEKGSKAVTMTELEFAKDLAAKERRPWFFNLASESATYGITRYNPVTKKIMLLTSAKAKKEKAFTSYLAIIDPVNNTVDYTQTVYPQQASEKSVELFGKKSEYDGMPQNLFINNDGTFSIIYEDISSTMRQSSMSLATSITSNLGNIAVSKFDVQGKETGSLLIPKDQVISNATLLPYYHSDREGSAQLLIKGNQFKSFAYLDGLSKSYILFNDVQSNTESVNKGKLTTIQGVSDCDGFYYDISGNDVFPGRKLVFGTPERKKDHNLALFAISDYDRSNNLYVTLKLEKEGRDKGVRLVWLQPQ